MWTSTNQNPLRLKLETLSPIHVGAGREVPFGALSRNVSGKKEEYALIDAGAYVDRVIGSIDERETLQSRIKQLEQKITEYGLPYEPGLVLRQVICSIPEDELPLSFKEQITLAVSGETIPYIPGSSLKGALRTAILAYLLGEKKDPIRNHGNRLPKEERDFRKNYGQSIRELFGGDAKEDLGRLMQVPDVPLPGNPTQIRLSFNKNWTNEGWITESKRSGKKMEVWLECIPAGIEARFQIGASKQLLALIHKHFEHYKKFGQIKQHGNQLVSVRPLFRLVNQHTSSLLAKEIHFLQNKRNTDLEIQSYYSQLVQWQNSLGSGPQDWCILRAGFGSGFRFITGFWQKDKLPPIRGEGGTEYDRLRNALRPKGSSGKGPFPKTLRMLEGGIPLGFIKISNE